MSDKLENSESALGRAGLFSQESQDKKTEDKLSRVTRDASKTTIEAVHGLMAQVIKDRLFNQVIPSSVEISVAKEQTLEDASAADVEMK